LTGRAEKDKSAKETKMDNVNNFKAAVTACIAVLTALWGWFGWLVVLFVVAMAADYLTGTAAAMQKGKWSSKAARDGIFHKVGSIVVVAVAGGADLLIGMICDHLPGVTLPFEYTVLLCPLVVVWYTLTELGSIVENAVSLGAPVPAWLQKALSAAKDAVDKIGDEEK
jgi:toxin secretion/phage lysis holin